MCISKGAHSGRGPNRQFIRASTGLMSCTLICCPAVHPFYSTPFSNTPKLLCFLNITITSSERAGLKAREQELKREIPIPIPCRAAASTRCGTQHHSCLASQALPPLRPSRSTQRALSTESHSTRAAPAAGEAAVLLRAHPPLLCGLEVPPSPSQ